MSVTQKSARTMALALPDAEEAPHFDTASFRVRGKIFATIGGADRMMVKLTPAEQQIYRDLIPAVAPVPGYWGAKGSTYVDLQAIAKEDLQGLLAVAWRNVAPKALLAAHAERLTRTLAAPLAPKLAGRAVKDAAPRAPKTKSTPRKNQTGAARGKR